MRTFSVYSGALSLAVEPLLRVIVIYIKEAKDSLKEAYRIITVIYKVVYSVNRINVQRGIKLRFHQ